jgi:hypothetical protein
MAECIVGIYRHDDNEDKCVNSYEIVKRQQTQRGKDFLLLNEGKPHKDTLIPLHCQSTKNIGTMFRCMGKY